MWVHVCVQVMCSYVHSMFAGGSEGRRRALRSLELELGSYELLHASARKHRGPL